MSAALELLSMRPGSARTWIEQVKRWRPLSPRPLPFGGE